MSNKIPKAKIDNVFRAVHPRLTFKTRAENAEVKKKIAPLRLLRLRKAAPSSALA